MLGRLREDHASTLVRRSERSAQDAELAQRQHQQQLEALAAQNAQKLQEAQVRVEPACRLGIVPCMFTL